MRRALHVLIAACVLAGCSAERRDWHSAQAADTLESYGRFLEEHPDGPRAVDARARIEQLIEERDWQRAVTADTAGAYERFLAQHPNGRWAAEARIRAENFVLSETMPAVPGTADRERLEPERARAAPDVARTEPQSADLERDAGRAGSRAESSAAGNTVERTGRHRFAVQLGAFSSARRAHDAWRQLAATFPDALAQLEPRVQLARTTSGRLYRLHAEVRDESQARALCAELGRAGRSCVVVLPR